jgi:cobalt-zinc-cadmium efflux system outer membrane protein
VKHAATTVTFCLLLSVVDAATPNSMRLEDLEQLALTNNPTMAQAEANVRVAAGLSRQASLYPNPTVGYYGDEIRGGSIGGGKQGAFVSQTIVLGGKLRAARRVAELEANQAETSAEIQRLRIQNNVRVLFYQALAAQRLVEVRQNLVKLAADATQTSRQLGNVGQADRPDILQAEVEEQQAKMGLRIAQQNLQACWSTLAAVIGQPDLAMAHLDGDLEAIPNLNQGEWVATTLRESLEVKWEQQAVQQAEASLVQAKKAPIPDLQVTGVLVQNREPLDTSRMQTGLEGGAQIGVQLPLFNRNQGNIAAARGEVESTRQNLAREKLQLQRAVAGMFGEYDSARTTVQQYKTEMLPRAEQAYRMYQENYQKMAAAYPQVLIAQRTFFQLQTEYIQALADAWTSSLAIRGFGLMDGLSEPLTSRPPMSGAMGSVPSQTIAIQ